LVADAAASAGASGAGAAGAAAGGAADATEDDAGRAAVTVFFFFAADFFAEGAGAGCSSTWTGLGPSRVEPVMLASVPDASGCSDTVCGW
jgi:hypothetical protein